MTDNTPNFDLEHVKKTFKAAQSKYRRLDRPTEEMQELLGVIQHAAATDRMGTDAEFAKYMNKELAPGITQEIAKIGSFDTNVSRLCFGNVSSPHLLCSMQL